MVKCEKIRTIVETIIGIVSLFLVFWTIISATFVKRIEFIEYRAKVDYIAESVTEIKERMK